MGKTKIEWADVTWNCVVGCSIKSSGCTNCYAMRMAATRLAHLPEYEGLAMMTPSGPRWAGKARLIEEKLLEPSRWRKPRTVFVNSMSDLFHESLEEWEIDKVFAAMALSSQHRFMVLTKRPERMKQYLGRPTCDSAARQHWWRSTESGVWPLQNVWLGVSVEDQASADARIPLLLETPAAKRFVSVEPLLGRIELGAFMPWQTTDPLERYKRSLDYVIVGGESGPGARRMDPEWLRLIVRQCAVSGTALHVKQVGTVLAREWGLKSTKGGDPQEWPEEFRVRDDGGR